MAEEPKATVVEPQTAPIPAVNTPFDAPSIFADTVQGLMLSGTTLKVFFLEHLIPFEETELRGRYVLNLTMPAAQLRAMGELFLKLAADYESRTSDQVAS